MIVSNVLLRDMKNRDSLDYSWSWADLWIQGSSVTDFLKALSVCLAFLAEHGNLIRTHSTDWDIWIQTTAKLWPCADECMTRLHQCVLLYSITVVLTDFKDSNTSYMSKDEGKLDFSCHDPFKYHLSLFLCQHKLCVYVCTCVCMGMTLIHSLTRFVLYHSER